MFDGWLLLLISLGYVAILFSIAYFGDRNNKKSKFRPWIYSLSLGVYCTTWSMLGTTSQAASTGWAVAPTYLGTILLLLFGFGLLTRITRVVRQQNLVSISDFIASRYGKSQPLAILVTLVSLVAIVPYISIQLKALADSFSLLVGDGYQSTTYFFFQPAFVTAVLMAIFAVLFGTRRINANEKHEGLILVLSFESVFKLLAFLLIGIYCVFFIDYSTITLNPVALAGVDSLMEKQSDTMSFMVQVGLGFVAIFLLPRQFHVAAVENNSPKELKAARWIFPSYLILFNLFILPISIVGLSLFGEGSKSLDALILTIPMLVGAENLTLLGFLGVLSAATSMVIIANVVLSTMLCNDVIVPLFFKKKFLTEKTTNIGHKLLIIRRFLIIIISLLAFIYYQFISGSNAIASTGLLSFALIAQFAPAVILAVYWKHASAKGVMSGIAVGVLLWAFTLLLPSLSDAGWISKEIVTHGLWGFAWLKPTNLLGLHGFDQITHGVLWSVTTNFMTCFLVSKQSQISAREKIQANRFVSTSTENFDVFDKAIYNQVTTKDLLLLTERFLGREATRVAFNDFTQRQGVEDIEACELGHLLAFTEHLLNGALGSASTKLVMDAAFSVNQIDFDNVVNIVEEATETFRFNRELLQSAVENISHGISVIDEDLNLVAWNNRYEKLFGYPDKMVLIGRPIADLIEFNLKQIITDKNEISTEVEKRLRYLREGSPHVFERKREDGKVLLIRGNPMPGGGFVTSYIDITQIRTQQKKLEEANQNLESRVKERTAALELTNAKLEVAKAEAEAANISKTRFLAAASHDILQPMTAAKLFTEALSEKSVVNDGEELISHLKQSLDSAENLLSDLLEISKLEAGVSHANPSAFNLDLLFKQLKTELTPFAKQEEIFFRVAKGEYQVYSDIKFLQRILQNFVVNAIKYSSRNKILLGCRRNGGYLKIQVLDTGPGISQSDQQLIFEEFTQLSQSNRTYSSGHGLGLAIAQSMARKLSTSVSVYSEMGRGCCFEISIPLIGKLKQASHKKQHSITAIENNFVEGCIVCIDNEPEILHAMDALLTGWGFKVIVAENTEAALELLKHESKVSLLLVDYHLNNNKTGIESIQKISDFYDFEIPAVIVSADRTAEIKKDAINKGYYWLEKPIKPLALRTLINQLVV